MFTVAVFLVWFFFAMYGACLGSFAGVVIFRLQKGESIVFPKSHCEHCQKPLMIWHNIPLFSWLLLRGRCYFCQTAIGLRPFILELIFAVAMVALYAHFGLSFAFIERLLFFFLLVCLSYIDIDSFSLPLSLLMALVMVGLAATFVYAINPDFYVPPRPSFSLLKFMVFKQTPYFSLWDRLWGALAGFLVLFIINLGVTALLRITKRLAKNQWAMGFGDPLLVMAIGLFIGASHLVLLLFLASFVGSLVGIMTRFFKHSSSLDQDIPEGALPFGPFLALAGMYIYLT